MLSLLRVLLLSRSGPTDIGPGISASDMPFDRASVIDVVVVIILQGLLERQFR